MSRDGVLAKILRIVGIVLMGITAVFTLMGGAGTTCVALAAEKFGEKMALLAPYQWLYILFVLVTLAIGVMGIRAVILLIKGRSNAYRFTLITLVSGIVVGVIHMAVSRSLRGSSMPVDGVVYMTILTLVVFLIYRIPAIWQGVNFEKPSPAQDLPRNAAAITLLFACLLTLTVQDWAGPTHMFDGVNYADAWHTQLTLLGWMLGLVGFGLLFAPSMKKLAQRMIASRRDVLKRTASL
jgi:hypothetical protein